MRWRNKRRARPRCHANSGANDQALGVDGNGMQPRLGKQQLCVGQRITGILDPHLIAGREQHTDCNVDCLLGARRDDDLRRLTTDRSRRPQIITDVLAQLGQAGGIGVAEIICPEPAHGAAGQAAPRLDGARIDQRAASVERAGVALHCRSLEVGKGLRRCRHGGLCRARSAAPSRCKAGQIARDERARAMAALEIAFGEQVLIRQNHGRTRHADLRCHFPRGWHARPGTERAGQHGGAHLHVELPFERRAARPIELPSIEIGPSAQGHRKSSL